MLVPNSQVAMRVHGHLYKYTYVIYDVESIREYKERWKWIILRACVTCFLFAPLSLSCGSVGVIRVVIKAFIKLSRRQPRSKTPFTLTTIILTTINIQSSYTSALTITSLSFYVYIYTYRYIIV